MTAPIAGAAAAGADGVPARGGVDRAPPERSIRAAARVRMVVPAAAHDAGAGVPAGSA